MKNRAFTLIELLVVISIIGLLSSIVFASLNVARERARIGAGKYQDANIYHALGDSAVGVWKFDEGSGTTQRDMSGNGNDLAYTGATWTTDTPSGTGSALTFNNANSAGIAAMSGLPVSEFTVTAWVRIGTHRDWTNIVTHSWGSSDGVWVFYIPATGKPTFAIKRLGVENNVSCISSISTGVWHFLVGTYDGANINAYVDGAKCAPPKPFVGQILDTTGGITVGVGAIGDMDEVKVYSRAYGG